MPYDTFRTGLAALLAALSLGPLPQSLRAAEGDSAPAVPAVSEPAEAAVVAEGPEEEEPRFQEIVSYDEDGNPLDPCQQFDASQESWLDASRVGLYRSVCGTAAWFDGFFGDSRYDERTGQTYGRLSLGAFYDRRDRLDERVRFRAKFAFPALRSLGSVFIEQGDADQIIEERGNSGFNEELESLGTANDNDLFAGFGFDKQRSIERGLSLRLGFRLKFPIETYAQARYRYAWQLTPNNLLRVQPLVYWRSDERFGSTLSTDLDNYIGDNFLLRWSSFGNVSQDPEVEGLLWGTSLTLFQALSGRRALTYSTFIRGETNADVRLQNYGFEVKFRHRFLREWLFIEYVSSVTWPREFLEEQRKINPGFGVRLEGHFGPTPATELR